MKGKNIFISHYHKDTEFAKKLEQRFADRGYFEFKSSTIDEETQIKSSDDRKIKRGLYPKINWASTVIVLIGKETHSRYYVNWEIKQAVKLGKNIVGIYLYGEKNSQVPRGVEKYGNSLVAWNNIDTIVDGIRGKSIWNEGRASKIIIPSDRSEC